MILFDLQLTGLIQNEKNTAISKHFTKLAEYIHISTGCVDKRLSGDFSIQTWLYTFRTKASKNRIKVYNLFIIMYVHV